MRFGWIISVCLLFFSPLLHASIQEVEPYLLPLEHPIRPLLQILFSEKRATLNLKTLKKAGFQKAKPRKFTNLIVTKHPAIPGYIFKLYLDAQRHHKETPEYAYWIARVQGANLVRQYIYDHFLEDRFKVPAKWIYELPASCREEGYAVKNFILVEEDMALLSDEQNKELWKSNFVTFSLLQELYGILHTVGLYDAAKPDNIPFSTDGKIAFIDTQTFGKKNVRYEKLTPFLSKENQEFWKIMTQ